MKSSLDPFRQRSLVLVFAYAPAGYGHLRVVDALYGGLPKDIPVLLLGSQDKRINALHRLFSIHPIMRRLFEWAQSGRPQRFVTWAYRGLLRMQTGLLYQQMTTIIDERIDVPTTVVVVATHFGLAHQLCVIKDRLMKEKKIRMVLALQVTDDSPQYIWYVPGADITFVPSEKTKAELIAYGKRAKLEPVNFAVIPYPISPVLTKPLPHVDIENREKQVSIDSTSAIHVAIPVSGAAVGMEFFIKLTDFLYQRSNRFHFDVLIKSTPYTSFFLNELISREYVSLHVFTNDRHVVSKYEDLYAQKTFSLEVTKPSEQAFKALAHATHRGGSILLFASPVGRQEHDNMAFLRRHQLIPSMGMQKRLWDLAERGVELEDGEKDEIFKNAKHWRGMELPFHSINAAKYVWWCLRQGLFSHMVKSKPPEKTAGVSANETGPDGVMEFWTHLSEYLEIKN